MKFTFITLSLFLSSLISNVYGQNITKTLINDKLDELFIKKTILLEIFQHRPLKNIFLRIPSFTILK
jgi:hypothetical protein